MSKDTPKYLVVKQFFRREIPRRVCNTLEQARRVAAACRQKSLATNIDIHLAQQDITAWLACVVIYRVDGDGRVVEYVEAI